ARVHDVDAGRDDRAGVSDQIGAGLDLETEGAAITLAKRLELPAYVSAHLTHVDSRLLGHATDLEATTQVHELPVGPLRDEIECHSRRPLPELGIRAGPDVGVQRLDRESVASRQRFHISEVVVPDPEAGRRATRVRALRGAAAESGIYSDRDSAASRRAPDRLELVQRTGVQQDSPRDVLREPARGHLRG